MSLVGVILGKPGTLLPQGAQPVPQPATAGPEPLAAAAAGTGSGSASGAGGGPTAGAYAASRDAAAAAQPSVAAAAAAAGTPVSAPATRRAFGKAEATPPAEDEAPTYPAQVERHWRLADVFAAIGGGPRAERLIEAANRPGPVAPGSLAEALKALCPAPTLETSRTV
jgi:DNA polymerase-3 subunit gamma/tau